MASISYTMQPIPPVDTVNQHAGLYVIFIMVVVIMAVYAMFKNDRQGYLGPTIVASFVVFISGIVSYNTGSIITYENRPVIGTLVGFQAEGFNESRQSGKSTRRVDVHYTYVIYNIAGHGDVLFQATQGQVYPDRAQLYANNALEQKDTTNDF